MFKVLEIRKDRQALIPVYRQPLKAQEVFLIIFGAYSLPQERDHAGICG